RRVELETKHRARDVRRTESRDRPRTKHSHAHDDGCDVEFQQTWVALWRQIALRESERLVDFDACVCDVVESEVGILLETPPEQTMNRGWCRVRQRTPVRLAIEDRGQRVGHRRPGERGVT